MDVLEAELIGRERELAEIERVLDPAALPAALLVEGEAGIGKSALCAQGVELARARGFETLVARPAETETELGLASIGDLLDPVVPRVLAALPPPQARALSVALLVVESDTAPDARALAVAFLGALRVLARDRPVLVVVDDVQWLDPSSAAVLRFAARRFGDAPVALLLTRRSGHADAVVPLLDEVRRLTLPGLTAGAVHRLLRARLGLVLGRPRLLRLHELSEGNPFYALELGRALEAGHVRLERGERLPPSLDGLLGHRIAALPRQTRDLLAAAAALSRPLASVVGARDALTPAIDAGVVMLDGDEIQFAHPLLASAAYAALPARERRELHARLADRVTDLEEHARHRSLATTGPDADVADELEVAAEGARRRGAVATAAELAERSIALTPGRDDPYDRRTLLHARCRLESGDAHGASRIIEDLVAALPAGQRRAAALADLARVQMFEGSRRSAVVLLREALRDARDPRLRLLVEERLVSMSTVLREDIHEAWKQARRSVDRAERLGDVEVLARALSALGFVGGVAGDPDAVAVLERGVALEPEPLVGLEQSRFNLAAVRMWRGELDEARSLFETAYRDTTDAGDDGSLAWIADNLANVEFLAGDWDAALEWAARGEELAVQTGQPAQQAYATATQALVHAHRGETGARALALRALELSGDEVAIGWMNARWALGVLELSLADAAAAHAVLGPACDHVERERIGEPGTTRFVFDDVEALIRLGELEAAGRRLQVVEAHARRLERSFALAAAARCRGLLASAAGDASAAADAFEAALAADHHATPFERARTLLAQGETLRRSKRRREARAALDEAARGFDELGASAFARKARDELARLGGRRAAGQQLTPMERKIAELAAGGLTNGEIAAAEFVTRKTVEFHLRNIYRKLGVRSRAELARRTF